MRKSKTLLRNKEELNSFFQPYLEFRAIEAIIQDLRVKYEPVLLTIYGKDEVKLIELHMKAVKAKVIEGDIDSWLFWFCGRPCNNRQKQILWNGKRTDLRYFLNELCPELEKMDVKFPSINKAFRTKNGRAIDSNDKIPQKYAYSRHKIDDIL